MLLIEFILHRRMVGRMAVIEEGRVVVIHSDDTTGPLHIERRAAQSPRTLNSPPVRDPRGAAHSPTLLQVRGNFTSRLVMEI